jgi:TRAP-type C4-dicarboxylate transport system permease small subunit
MQQARQTEPTEPGSIIARIIAPLVRVEEILLTILLSALIGLACWQIGARWFISGSVAWIDPLLRYLVLWSGLLGAVLATAKDNHISLDAVGYLLLGRVKLWVGLLTRLFCVVVSFFLFRATLLFISSEIEFGGSTLFGLASWIWNLIFPVAFFLILLHFILGVISQVISIINYIQPDTGK